MALWGSGVRIPSAPPSSRRVARVAVAFRLLPAFPFFHLPYSALMNHVGIGYDVHPLVAGRKLILGGVEIPHPTGLDGHSDADVLMHAICDAVLGALGKGDIGTFFPNTDPRWRGVASKVFLEEAARQVAFHQGV